MGNIHIIQDYEKIAAGEVIERPASIVKELLENSIDSGATRIEIRVKNAGKKLIKVIDNGSGIEPDDMLLAFERHTTSKIFDFSDVYNLDTLGFRGEALASIKAGAKVEMISRTNEHELGKKIRFTGDTLEEESEIAATQGTTISVKDLFFNIPVRRKFLKSKSVEFSHISDIVTRYALVNHEIDIKLYHDERIVINAPPSNGQLLNTIVSIYGTEHGTNMIEVEEEGEDFSLHGYIAKPAITRSSRSYSSLFVNNRFVYSIDIAKAIEDAYRGRVMKNRYPFFVLFLSIKPELIDVNIHPSKKEVKFSNEKELVDSIRQVIRETLKKQVQKVQIPSLETALDSHVGVTPKKSPKKERIPNKKVSAKPDVKTQTYIGKAEEKKTRSTIPKAALDLDREFSASLEKPKHVKHASIEITEEGAKNNTKTGFKPKLSGWKPLIAQETEIKNAPVDTGTFRNLPMLSPLYKGFQMENTFLFFVSSEGDLIIVDQHAASERVEYEKIIKKFKSADKKGQELLVPKKLELSPSMKVILKENLEKLRNFGFDFTEKTEDGNLTVYISKFPYIFHKGVEFGVIEDFLEELLSQESNALETSQDEILQLMACHSAIRAGDKLEPREIWKLLMDLDACDDPHHCCHGRPTWIRKSFNWLEKEFKRIV